MSPSRRAAVHLVPVLHLVMVLLVAAACGSTASVVTPQTSSSPTTESPTSSPIPTMVAPEPLTGSIRYEIVNRFPHDSDAFTQGLEEVDGRLLESVGLLDRSDRREVDLASGEIISRQPLDPELFAEGMTERQGLLYQLTYNAGIVIVSNADTLVDTGERFTYEGEGWGICAADALEGEPFVMSNGSAELMIRDPETFAVLRTLEVVDGDGRPVERLNELECVGNNVLANVWKSDLVISIDLAEGAVIGVLDLSELGPDDADPDRAVLNGIAYRPASGTYLVTGKLWPTLYELELSGS
ncbi:MAG: glutaminyl-peptide cyclotransferase [Acidimicrobiales bacterium]|nr:glutaminyl-peptide cyclotransferase [Acidimicrobiales bacterium]